MNPKIIRRLTKEFDEINQHSDYGIKAELVNNDLKDWVITFKGPDDTPYHDLQFRLSIKFTDGYPFEIPSFRLLSKVYHPNVYSDGSICLDVIQRSKWSPAASMEARVFNIILLLQEPNPNSPANGDAARTWRSGPDAMRTAVMRGKRAIHRLLIANNGIAAVKAIRSIRKWCYETFENDRIISIVVMATPEDLAANAEYIRMADKYFEVPGGANNNNYANVTRIVDIAESAKCDAVWAGWGHASENPVLPDRLSKKGILFLGPCSTAMKSLGDKIDSTLIAQCARIPSLPWNGSSLQMSMEDLQSENRTLVVPEWAYEHLNIHSTKEAMKVAEEVGFPLMIKASEGGGGKGIRVVRTMEGIADAFRAVQGEVPGSPIFMMRLAEHCRHLEVQLIADEYGNTIPLSGRDCSVQRRHQKIIEEGPPSVVSAEVWKEMQLAAVRLAKLVNYTNVGTVEYLYMEDGTYSFLELNPRLQVEHPVTEMITGVNLPAAQLQIAMGIPLYCIPDIRRLYGESESGVTVIPFDERSPIRPRGYVIACRITAENPDAGFQPTSGAIRELNFRSTANVWGYFSVDGSGRVHEYADSQFGHLFSWGRSRETARKSMVQALREFSIRGEIRTTIEYLLQLIQSEAYVKNTICTSWLDGLIQHHLPTAKPDACFVVLMTAACKGYMRFKQKKREFIEAVLRGQYSSSSLLCSTHHEELIYDNMKYIVDVFWSGETLLTLAINNSSTQVHIRELADGGFLINHHGQSHVMYVMERAGDLRLNIDGITCVFSQEYDPSVLRCPNSGKLARYLVQCGDHVVPGQTYAEMEVMKMYLPLVVTEAGTITQLVKAVGSVVQNGDTLGYMKINDMSKVKKAELFTSTLPKEENSEEGIHPQSIISNALVILHSFLSGYWITEEQARQSLESLLTATKNASLPFYEYVDVLSTMESILPDDLKQKLNDVLFAAENSPGTNSTEELTTECPPRVTGVETVQPFNQEFPAARIRQVLTEYLLRSANQLQLQKELNPLFEVTAKYRDGLPGYRASLLFELIDCFITSQHVYATLHASSKEPLRSIDNAYSERVWKSEFGHQHQAMQAAQAALVTTMLTLLAPLVSVMDEENAHFTEVLQTLSLLSDTDVSLSELVLEARQLQLQRKLPSQEEELNELRSALKSIAAAEGKERESAFTRFLNNGGDVQQPLLTVLSDQNETLRELALECYLRKIYQPYMLLTIDRCELDNLLALTFQFASELSELPTGICPSESVNECSSEANSPCSSPQAPDSEDESADTISGIIVSTHSEEEVTSTLSRSLSFWMDRSAGGHKRVLHIILNQAPNAPYTELIPRYQAMLEPFKSELETLGITRITLSQPSSASHSSFWDLPFSVTFRQRFHYQEDPLVRFIEPPLAYHLELDRLRNFNIRLVPIPNRSIHLYEATPKEPIVIRRSPMPLSRRFFVRAVCSTMDSWQTSSITDTYPSAEKALVEALGALEMGVGEVRAKGMESSITGSHIFLNILAPIAIDPDLIEQIMKRLYQRYVKRISSLHVTQVEMCLLPVLAEGSSPIPIRMVGSDPTGMALRIDTYVETKDPFTGSVIFTSINGHITENAGEWDGHAVSMAYPVLEYLERERAYAQRASHTLYCYDFLELIQRVLLRRWKTYMKSVGVLHAVMPPSVMKVRELELTENRPYELREVSRPPGRNKIGMVAWQITLFTPTYPKEGREVMVIANDITFKAGSFGTREDLFFDLVSKRARRMGIPRIYFAANSGARIGLAEEVKEAFRVKWREEGNPQSGVDFLYLTQPDYERVKDGVKVHAVEVDGRRVYRIDAVVGREKDLGVENLAGSALIAGETSRAYKDIVTLTIVSGRSVGIGAYLVRLGQRTIQKAADAPIILTGYEALNNLMGKSVYSSNDQLGGPNIMCPNGVTHLRVGNDYEAVDAMMRWLSFIPRTRHAELLPQPLSPAVDVIDRPVTVRLSQEPYDVRYLLCGTEEGEWQAGLFDRDSFMEILTDWARTVVVGRARLGGIPVGVIATENRTVESVTPADPAMLQSETVVLQQAGGVWYPDSAFKTAQAIQDINQEGLPLFIIANWRGFSGGARDMFREVLKFGACIVDQLVAFQQPVFVYIPAFAELRGGAFVVVDPHINEEVMEMYADSRARAGVLEPAGVVSIKFREEDRQKVMRRNEKQQGSAITSDEMGRQAASEEMGRQAASEEMGKQATSEEMGKQATSEEMENRQKELETAYRQVAEVFADLHDGAERMKAVGVIRQIVDVEQSRRFFYWRLRRRLLERTMEKDIINASGMDWRDAHATLLKWFEQSTQMHSAQDHEADQRMLEWLTQERDNFIAFQIDALQRTSIREEVRKMGMKSPDAVAEGMRAVLGSLSPEDRERMLASLTSLE